MVVAQNYAIESRGIEYRWHRAMDEIKEKYLGSRAMDTSSNRLLSL